jgi:2-keto-3-deoxy-L-rhamnonate aldolase RhmA
VWGNVPGGYRNTINDNVVLFLMIETLEGLQHADEIARLCPDDVQHYRCAGNCVFFYASS